MIIFWKKYFFSAYYRLILQNLAENFHAYQKLPERKISFPPMVPIFKIHGKEAPLFQDFFLDLDWIVYQR